MYLWNEERIFQVMLLNHNKMKSFLGRMITGAYLHFYTELSALILKKFHIYEKALQQDLALSPVRPRFESQFKFPVVVVIW